MKITEVTKTNKQALTEAIDVENGTGFLTEDLVNIVEAHETGAWSKPVSGDEMMAIIESWFG